LIVAICLFRKHLSCLARLLLKPSCKRLPDYSVPAAQPWSTEPKAKAQKRESQRMRVRHPHQGFNLIELMIVIAIVAILVPTVLPARVDYAPRAKVTGAPSVVAEPQVFVSESCQFDADQSFRSIVGVPYITSFLPPADSRITGMQAQPVSDPRGVPFIVQ
jgi:prepilin-type N-terminal cleavage/methylation domain-containing protein